MSLYNIFNNILGSTIATNSGAVTSVAGKTGAVSLVSTDITNFQPSVSLNTDVVNSKIIIQKLDTSVNTIDEIKPAIGGLINLGSALQKFKEGHFNFLKSVEVHTDIIRVKTLGGGTNLEITNDQGQGIILESGQNGVVNFTGFAYNNGTGKYLKMIDQNGKIGIGTVIDAPTNTTINTIPRFSNTEGQVKESNVSISDTGNITCSGLKFNNLVGPGILKIDANGNVFVDINLITPTNLTSNTSDSNFIVSRSSIKDNDPNNEAYKMFDSQAFHPVWLCGNNQYDWIGGHANGNDSFQGITGAWFKISLNTAKSWNQYTIQPTFREELLSSWRIYGSNDDINYSLISSQTDYTFPNFTNQNLLTETFNLGYEVSYKYLVFHVTKIRNENNSLRMYFGIREFRFNKI